MRWLGLMLALVLLGGIRSSGQISSVNDVGYINLEIKPGANLVANQLRAEDMRLASLFNPLFLPNDTRICKFDGAGYKIAHFNATAASSTSEGMEEETLLPGEGAFVINPTTQSFTITFVGEILQGNLTNHIPTGLSLRSSMVPREATLEQMGFVPQAGDQVYLFNPSTQTFETRGFIPGMGWLPAMRKIKVGEAFFIRTTTPRNWVQTFWISNPESVSALNTTPSLHLLY